MSLADQLIQLEQLRERGSLTEEEFARAKHRVLHGVAASPPGLQAVNGYRRSSTDRWFGGVCGGLGVATGMAAWIWRVVFVVLLMAGGTGLLAYLIIWLFAPLESTLPALSNQTPY